jgi:chromosome segregation ATPase
MADENETVTDETRTPRPEPGSRRSGLIVALIAVAVVGWAAVVWLATSRASLREELTQQVTEAQQAQDEVAASLAALENASGQLTDIQGQVATEQETLAGIRAERETAQQEHDSELERLTAETAAARRVLELQLAEVADIAAAARGKSRAAEARLAHLTSQVEGRQRSLDQLRSQALQTAQRLMAEQAAVGLAEARTSEQARKLVGVGQRVQTVREQEAEAQSRLATLTNEAADLTQNLAQAAQRTQAARVAEASRQEQLMRAQGEFSRIRVHRDQLASNVDQLQDRLDTLRSDVADAEQQRARVQQQVTEVTATLANRSGELQELEARIGELQSQGAALSGSSGSRSDASSTDEEAAEVPAGDQPVQEASLEPGKYQAGAIELDLRQDGAFTLHDPERSRFVSGRYEIKDGALTLDEAIGDMAAGEYPMQCSVESQDGGFRLASDNGGCAELAGTAFVPAGASQ